MFINNILKVSLIKNPTAMNQNLADLFIFLGRLHLNIRADVLRNELGTHEFAATCSALSLKVRLPRDEIHFYSERGSVAHKALILIIPVLRLISFKLSLGPIYSDDIRIFKFLAVLVVDVQIAIFTA